MKSSMNKIVASLRFDPDDMPSFWMLAAPVSACLRQADVTILHHALALDGQTMEYETDHGRIELEAEQSRGRIGTLTISADIDTVCSREVARQLCFLLSTRIASRYRLSSIHWQPTRQTLAPANFRWGALQDMPDPFRALATHDGNHSARPS